ncbi:ribonuclease III [Clostridium fermenticellae]|uniref:Ribonuclease 3 n=1 Tax=Clostridium fermenticellae TaxID=2068654 RepID=A0A386H2U6_9CLOT|nr:ribonuclease III [Clostridium fermenticellae]AYD40037.1 ribonuclease III [Clostridium fermenticellae]
MKRDTYVLDDLELKLGVIFSDKDILKTAVTHSSYANGNKNIKFNERLEFLGDAVLQICISEYLFLNYTNKAEGELTRKRALIVCENSLYEVAKNLGVGKYIRMSKGEELTGGRERVSILADCMEAIIAAIYIDKGIEQARVFVMSNFKNIIEKAMLNKIILDYKTKLQEIAQKNGYVDIEYNLLKYDGPPHRRKFYTQVLVNEKMLGNGTGYSKKEAEQNAARCALDNMEEEDE